MKRFLIILLVAVLVFCSVQTAFAQSFSGVSNALEDYELELIRSEVKEESSLGGATLLLHFRFVNNGTRVLSSIPLEVRARQNGVELTCVQADLKPVGGALAPQGETAFDVVFLLDNARDDVTYSASMFFNPAAGEITGTVSPGAPQAREKGNDPIPTERPVETDEGDAELGLRAEALLDEELYEEALALYDEALAKYPNDGAYHFGRGKALLNLDRLDEALEAHNRAIELDASNSDYYNERGVVYYFMYDDDAAYADFDKAVSLGPTEDSPYYNLAYVQAERGDLESAVITCAFGLTDFPESADLLVLLGDVQFERTHYAEALECYDRALALGTYTVEEIDHYAEARQLTSKPGKSITRPSVQPSVPQQLFDEGVRDLSCEAYGNSVDYAQLEGWIIRRGYLEDLERYCLVGLSPSGERMALTEVLPGSIVPVGDAYIYYGADENGQYGWVIREAGADMARRLNLAADDNVFYADAEYIWYETPSGLETVIRRLPRVGWANEEVARTRGTVVCMLADRGVLVADFEGNELKRVDASGETTLYKPSEAILVVATQGKSIWVEHEGEFGLLEDGALGFRLPGQIESMAGTTDQFVFLLSFPDSSQYDVILFNDLYRAYVRVGSVLASPDAFIELQPGYEMTVWGPEESLIFDIPQALDWIPYGYYDVESARNAGASFTR